MNNEPAQPTILPPGEVNVWLLRLDVPEAKAASLGALLTPDETARANRLRREEDRKRFVVARGRLRQILGQYLAISPTAVKLAVENRGKPFVKSSPVPIHFNLSHSHRLALLAVSSSGAVGVDVEFAREPGSGFDAAGLARRFFSAAESEAILGASEEGARLSRFYRCWTRKEAFVKALGGGISSGLEQFDVMSPDSPDGPAMLLAHRVDASLPGRWALRDLSMPGGYFGALCAQAPLTHAPILTLPG